MEIKFENIILRDMIESGIKDYVRRFTTETEWSNTDAPWEPKSLALQSVIAMLVYERLTGINMMD